MSDADARLAEALAARAVEALEAVRRDSGLDGAALKGLGDATAQALLAAALLRERPADAVLSEEAADDPARLDADRVWIVDPLDGTREYSEHRDDWAVHVALWTRTAGLAAGAVATPGDVRSTRDPRPAVADPDPVEAGGRPLRLAVSRSRPPAIVAALVALLGAEPVPMGSAGVKTMSVVDGSVDAYVHGGGQYEWDSAAPVAVARAAGLHTSRLDGAPLVYNRADPWLPDLVVCPSPLAQHLLAAIASVGEEDA